MAGKVVIEASAKHTATVFLSISFPQFPIRDDAAMYVTVDRRLTIPFILSVCAHAGHLLSWTRRYWVRESS